MRLILPSVLVIAGLAITPPAWAQVDSTEVLQNETSEAADNPSKWRFAIRPYLFLSGVSGSVTVDPLTFPINSSFTDILDNLSFGGFLSFSAEKGRWGAYTDFAYISLVGKSQTAQDAELELENFIAEGDVTYQPGRATSLRFMLGARVYSIAQTFRIQGEPLLESDMTIVDPILGAMGDWQLGERWNFEIRGDIGGFGVGSEFTYQLFTAFRWDISNTVSLPFGYRILGYRIKTESVWMNTQMGGLLLGLDIRF